MARLIDFIAGHDARHRIILGSVAGAAVFFLSTDIIALGIPLPFVSSLQHG